jgi:tetratricopeptide (TPR) repeat protein
MNPLDRWQSLDARVVALYQQGWYAEAVNLAEENLKFAEESFGPDHVNVAESLNKLALIYCAQGKEVEAAMVDQRLLNGEEEAKPSAYPPSARSLHRLVLTQLAKQKYGLAHGLLDRALTIKQTILGESHPEVVQILGTMADLSHARNVAESSSHLSSTEERSADGAGGGDAIQAPDKEIRLHSRKREHARCTGHFVAELSKTGVSGTMRGITENIGQSGAFIKIKEWRAFRAKDEVDVAIFLPSIFSDESATVQMEGRGFVARVDEEQEGVAVEFRDAFRHFKRREQVEVPGKVRYRKLAHYLAALETTPLEAFRERFPRGFLIERFETIFDKDVIFQFSTRQFTDQDFHLHSDQGGSDMHILEARVIEITKRKNDNEEHIITIGRASSNDIVLYNKVVSKSHAFLYFPPDDRTAYIADVGSTNCTFVNDQKLAPYEIYPLAESDEISFGPQTKVIYLSPVGFYQLLVNVKGTNPVHADEAETAAQGTDT